MYTPSATGGHALYSRELLRAMVSEVGSHRMELSLMTSEDLSAEFEGNEYPIHRVLPRLRPLSEFRTRLEWIGSRLLHYQRRERRFLRSALEEADWDAVHFQEYTPWLAPAHFPMLRRRGVRIFYTVHNIVPHTYPPGIPPRLIDALQYRAWRACHGLFVHTEGLRRRLIVALGRGHPPIFVTPHGVWSGPTEKGPLVTVEDRIKARTLLFFGVIRPNKGLHLLLRALQRMPDIKLRIAGAPDDSHYAEQIRGLVARLPPGQVQVDFRHIEEQELKTLFANCTAVALPYTQFSAQSGVLFLAAGHGIPVVSSDAGGLGEIVQSEGLGTVAHADDELSLQEAVRELLREDRYTAATHAIERFRSRASWQQTARLTLEAYARVLGEAA
jgi:glycosyltransferase involved in cell wall biosynthesis